MQTDHSIEQTDNERPVQIDHLAFSFKITELRHCHKADLSDFKWAKLPKARYQAIVNPELRQERLEQYQSELRDVLTDRLATFLFYVMGLKCSPMRGRGLHGYQDSAVLLDKSGKVECGLMGVGGNADTVYVQISGRGCKYLFEHIDSFRLHWWLTKILCITSLSRLDLCVDDFSNEFNCDFAEQAYWGGKFRTATRGMWPAVDVHRKVRGSSTGKTTIEEAVLVGARDSAIYWRVYNKALEQGLNNDTSWYRNEVELKKCDIDALLKPAAAFSGICAFAATIEPTEGISVKRQTKESCLDLAGRIRWTRRQCGKALTEIVKMFNGDTQKAFGLLIPPIQQDPFELEDYGKIAIPNTYQQLITTAMEI